MVQSKRAQRFFLLSMGVYGNFAPRARFGACQSRNQRKRSAPGFKNCTDGSSDFRLWQMLARVEKFAGIFRSETGACRFGTRANLFRYRAQNSLKLAIVIQRALSWI
jgi:hypothetical protein